MHIMRVSPLKDSRYIKTEVTMSHGPKLILLEESKAFYTSLRPKSQQSHKQLRSGQGAGRRGQRLPLGGSAKPNGGQTASFIAPGDESHPHKDAL